APVDRELSRLSASPPQTAAGAFEDYRSPPPTIHRPDPSRSTKLIGDDRRPTRSVVVPQSDFDPERSNLAADGGLPVFLVSTRPARLVPWPLHPVTETGCGQRRRWRMRSWTLPLSVKTS